MPIPAGQARHVALLRGINLGPTRKVPMAELRGLAEGLGWTGVSTYVNSGNLLFTAAGPEELLAAALSAALADRFGFAVPVAVRSADELRAAVAATPFPDGDPKRVCVCFLRQAPDDAARERLLAAARGDERVEVIGRELHLHFPDGQADSVLASRLIALVGQEVATTRNLSTGRALVRLLG